MNITWGVYGLQGKTAGGVHVSANDRLAKRWFIRWRVNGRAHKRTFDRKGHAKTFQESLISAKAQGLDADERGFPVANAGGGSEGTSVGRGAVRNSRSFESYCVEVWWPNIGADMGEKNRAGHRKNMRDAIAWLRYRDGDPRVGAKPNAEVGLSIRLDDLDSDDIKYALRCRRGHNDRATAANQRRISAAVDYSDDVTVELLPAIASDRTVQAFWVTLGMIVRSAAASRQADRGCLEGGAAALAPRPKRQPVSTRLVPSIQEVFDLADAIAQLGPRMPDGRPAGERFRALVLAGGTLGARPGELVAHQPEWFDRADGITYMVFNGTEAPFYDREAGVRGRTVRPLKHREVGDFRAVPALEEVASALRLHLDRGYNRPDRTFSSFTGTARLTWGNITDAFWRPACEKVFANSDKPALAHMSPKTLRKAAITFWLDSGISLSQAAEWAGHSEDVAQRYYAGRVSPGFAREAAMLARGAADVRGADWSA
jgi:integrase